MVRETYVLGGQQGVGDLGNYAGRRMGRGLREWQSRAPHGSVEDAVFPRADVDRQWPHSVGLSPHWLCRAVDAPDDDLKAPAGAPAVQSFGSPKLGFSKLSLFERLGFSRVDPAH